MYVKRCKDFSENKYLKSWLVVQNLVVQKMSGLNSRSFSNALPSDDSSSQESDEKLRRYEHFNQGNSQVLYHQPTLQIFSKTVQ